MTMGADGMSEAEVDLSNSSTLADSDPNTTDVSKFAGFYLIAGLTDEAGALGVCATGGATFSTTDGRGRDGGAIGASSSWADVKGGDGSGGGGGGGAAASSISPRKAGIRSRSAALVFIVKPSSEPNSSAPDGSDASPDESMACDSEGGGAAGGGGGAHGVDSLVGA